jgi:hypothetical protein
LLTQQIVYVPKTHQFITYAFWNCSTIGFVGGIYIATRTELAIVVIHATNYISTDRVISMIVIIKIIANCFGLLRADSSFVIATCTINQGVITTIIRVYFTTGRPWVEFVALYAAPCQCTLGRCIIIIATISAGITIRVIIVSADPSLRTTRTPFWAGESGT